MQDIHAWQHPVIVLRDVPFSDLQGIVEFIYHGEVSIDQENLTSFLKTAQALRVKGLADDHALASANSVSGNGPAPQRTAGSKPPSSSPSSSQEGPAPLLAMANGDEGRIEGILL